MIEFLSRRWHRLLQPRFEEVRPLRPVSLDDGTDRVERLLETRPLLQKVLSENILPFWVGECIDREQGGYRLHHDPQGRWKGPAEKYCVPHARMVWFFARAARGGHLPGGLDLARHGLEFLRGAMWDGDEGGFFWSVTSDGAGPVDDSKKLFAQSIALYALAEYARASGDPEATRFAGHVAAHMEERFHDQEHGGYFSEFERGWTFPPLDGPRGANAHVKTVNENLHALEALSAFSFLEDSAWVQTRLLELIVALTGSALRKEAGVNTDRHRLDWTPILGGGKGQVSYGHDLETVWLVSEACDRVGFPFSLVADWSRALVRSTLRWGVDKRRGGVYFAGPVGGPAHTRVKVWWVQAETLVGALTAFLRTGDEECAAFYLSTLDWITARHVDWSGGDWHALIHPGGKVSGDKAGLWKSPYHNGRAMIRCMELLSPRATEEPPMPRTKP